MTKATAAQFLGWLQLFLIVVGETIQAQGAPKDLHSWGHILASAAIAFAIRHASGTDGTK